MNIRSLRSFEAAATAENFRLAAEQQHITQPALSKQIAQLEEELGCKLFLRQKQRVYLSPEGKIFLQHSRRILKEVDAAIESVSLISREHSGTLRIGIKEMIGRFPLVSSGMQHFRSLYPKVELRLEQLTTIEICNALLKGELDVAIMHAPPAEYTQLARVPLLEESIFLAVSHSNPLARKTVVHLKELESEDFLWFKRSKTTYYANWIMALVESKGLTPNIVQEVNSEAALLNLAAAGLGVFFGPASHASSAPQGIVFKTIEEVNETIVLELVAHSMNTSTLTKHFLELMQSNI